ncbi:hypothetical protein [Marinoscillum sp. MHG1-6]|uniref:hypothetical protein n=1 Tax=Marinoscillum sp. MHG1-6 TaxID=2959627 RepID=UPI0021573897|nr:hypothetical protein [Marinoscillum sp. MHG1-6]
MKRLFITCFLITILCDLLAQGSARERDIWRTTDSILVTQTSRQFLNSLKRNDLYFSDLTPLDSVNTSYRKRTVNVSYTIQSDNGFILHQRTSGKGLGPVGAYFELDSNNSIIYTSDLDLSYQAFKTKSATNVMNSEKAKTISEEHFSSNMKFPILPCLQIYDDELTKVLWQIDKFSGFMNVKKETVEIDAETGELINKRTASFKRNFWRAVFQNKRM